MFFSRGLKTEEFGCTRVEIAERIRVVQLAIDMQLVSRRVPTGAAAKIAFVVEGQDRRGVIRRCKIRRGRMSRMMLDHGNTGVRELLAEGHMHGRFGTERPYDGHAFDVFR